MIYFRVDGNEMIATGHVMRCLSIAEALRAAGEESTFLLADDRPKALITAKGFSCVVLHSTWNDMEAECDALIACIREKGIRTLVIDSYYVTERYLFRIAECARLVYIDDMDAFVYPVDLLINYGLLSNRVPYAEKYAAAGRTTRFLLGVRYAPLRGEFCNVPYRVRDAVEDIMITTGGTDRYNVAGQVLTAALRCPELRGLRYHVVVGCFHRHKEMLEQLAKAHANVRLYENITHMSDLMRSCDIAVTAGGSTTYELCAVGIPSVCLSIADNQSGADAWEREGVMRYAGSIEEDAPGCIARVTEHLLTYVRDGALRRNLSARMRGLVDGRGAERIAEKVMEINRLAADVSGQK